MPLPIASFRITRYQFRRHRPIGDSQVRADDVHAAALELIAEDGSVGLGFMQSLFFPLPSEAELTRVFAAEVFPALEGEQAGTLVHRISRPRGGKQRAASIPVHEAVQVALWDLFSKQLGMPLYRLLGGGHKDRMRAYASGLDFHLSDHEFTELFGKADAEGFSAFKIKVGHPDFEWDLNRLALLKKTVRADAAIMIDANEAWGAKEALVKISAIEDLGYRLTWVEDPILRSDFHGLKMLCQATANTLINSGEYLDASGKRALMTAGATDMVNVHGQITDVMHVGWLAAELGVPVSLGNTFLEIGLHSALALPEVEWLEYSFQNFDHLVDETFEVRDGFFIAPERPGHGLILNETTRREWARPAVVAPEDIGPVPPGSAPGILAAPA